MFSLDAFLNVTFSVFLEQLFSNSVIIRFYECSLKGNALMCNGFS